jgi:hypothetical protein
MIHQGSDARLGRRRRRRRRSGPGLDGGPRSPLALVLDSSGAGGPSPDGHYAALAASSSGPASCTIPAQAVAGATVSQVTLRGPVPRWRPAGHTQGLPAPARLTGGGLGPPPGPRPAAGRCQTCAASGCCLITPSYSNSVPTGLDDSESAAWGLAPGRAGPGGAGRRRRSDRLLARRPPRARRRGGLALSDIAGCPAGRAFEFKPSS